MNNIAISPSSFLQNYLAAANSTSAAPVTHPQHIPLNYEILLQYARTLLHQSDDQINEQLTAQSGMQQATSDVNDVQAMFAQSTNGLSYDQTKTAIDKLTEAANTLPNGDQEKAQIQKEIGTLNDSLGKNSPETTKPVIIQQDCKSYADALGSISKDIGNESQLQLMTLQSLMSQRGTSADQLSGMLKAIADSLKNTANNFGH